MPFLDHEPLDSDKGLCAIYYNDYEVLELKCPSKLEAMEKKFPWLRKIEEFLLLGGYIDKPIAGADVLKIESSILDYSPTWFSYLLSKRMDEILVPLNGKGELIMTTEKQKIGSFWRGYREESVTIPSIIFPGSSLRDVVKRLGKKSDDIRFIVCFYDLTQLAIIHILPKSVFLRNLIDRESKLERARLQRKLTNIN